jgi:hypothetical protein
MKSSSHLVLPPGLHVFAVAIQGCVDGVEQASGAAADHQQHLGAAGSRLGTIMQQLLNQSCSNHSTSRQGDFY